MTALVMLLSLSLMADVAESCSLGASPTAEQAREALINFVENDIKGKLPSGDGPKLEQILMSKEYLGSLRNSKIVMQGKHAFIGDWSCNLVERRFNVTIAIGISEYSVTGFFESVGQNEKWRAKFRSLLHAKR